MESPLEVLSRAATMVETTEKIGDALLGGGGCRGGGGGVVVVENGNGGDGYEAVGLLSAGGGKELSTRSLKAERVKERQELGHVLRLDPDHVLSLQARKTATISTQTQYSSFKGEAPPYPGPPSGPPPAYFASHDSYHHSLHQGYRPPPPPPPPLPPVPLSSSSLSSSSSPPTSGHLVDLSQRALQESSSDVQNAPLNLSISSSSNSNGVSTAAAGRQAARPAVITCLSSSSPLSLSSSRESSPRAHVHGVSGPQNGHDSPRTGSPPVSDPAIEEHFRRSLGRSYEDSIPKTMPSPTAAADPTNVSVTESVDDHFAKALGDSTWNAIKSQKDPAMDVFTGSVDDHFAKALGATTWRRIKAETELSENGVGSKTNGGYSPSRAPPTSPPSSSLSATVAS